MERQGMTTGALAVCAVLVLPAASACARACHAPRTHGFPNIAKLDVFGGATCRSGTAVATDLAKQAHANTFDGTNYSLKYAGAWADIYRCRFTMALSAQGDPVNVATCRQGRRQVRIRFGG
jgi:hypothetical protein